MKKLLLMLLLVGLVPVAAAHRSAAALYALDQDLEIEGVVTEFRFVNPHLRIYLDVTTDSGDVVEWMAEGGTPIVLTRLGWSSQEIKPGVRLRVIGNPARDGSNLVHLVTITLPDGTELFGEDVDFQAVDRRRRQLQE